jgi:hypothetical protein
MVPIESHVKRPAVVELIKAFGRGELQHGAAQAAAWHLNSDVSWAALAAKLQGTERSLVRPSYFSRQEMQAAMAYAGEASRRGQLAEMQQPSTGTTGLVDSSEALSTTPDPATKTVSSTDANTSEAVEDKDGAKAEKAGAKQRNRRTRPATNRNNETRPANADPAAAATQP